jgi:hypothetical protein
MPRKNRQKAITSITYDGYGVSELGIVGLALEAVGTVTVNFGDGTTYDYDGVPIMVFWEFEASGPSGAFFNANIRGVYD